MATLPFKNEQPATFFQIRPQTARLIGIFLAVVACGFLIVYIKPMRDTLTIVQSGPPFFTSGLKIVNEERRVRMTISLWEKGSPFLAMDSSSDSNRLVHTVMLPSTVKKNPGLGSPGQRSICRWPAKITEFLQSDEGTEVRRILQEFKCSAAQRTHRWYAF